MANRAAILGKALESLAGVVKKVDIGDMTRPITSARLEALKKMVPKVDDWGWKGGKEGEITGIEFFKKAESLKSNPNDTALLLQQVGDQLSAFSGTGMPLARGRTARLMEDFENLELADIPRKWTGKIMKASGGDLSRLGRKFGSQITGPKDIAISISDTMRPMTNDQRETFLALLPDWSGSLDDLAEAARNL